MKGRLAIFLTVLVMVVVLVALNAASYVRVEPEQERELAPDRSTLNTGPTGTRAFHDYLKESGLEVSRWGRPLTELGAAAGRTQPSTLVVVGPLRTELDEAETEALAAWVLGGGRLVVIDRMPAPNLLPASGLWRVMAEIVEMPDLEVRPDDVEAMTRGVPLLAPSQPTPLVRDVEQVTRSRFASRLHVTRAEPVAVAGGGGGGVIVGSRSGGGGGGGVGPGTGGGRAAPRVHTEEPPPPPAPAHTPGGGSAGHKRADASDEEEEEEDVVAPAPVEHIVEADRRGGALLVDYDYGAGRVVVLSDPYVVSNAGINRADNVLLAANLVGRGPVAFDEYHQGYGSTRNQLFAYFANTPVMWLFGQAAVVVLAVVWTRGRRFARPLPAPGVDRRSKLEFVASMAELQQRARAYDLAIENIYSRTRRALARYAGLQATATAEQIAQRVAARSGRDPAHLSAVMRECEEAMAGAKLSARRSVALARELRTLERDLGIQMRAREVRQAEKSSSQ